MVRPTTTSSVTAQSHRGAARVSLPGDLGCTEGAAIAFRNPVVRRGTVTADPKSG